MGARIRDESGGLVHGSQNIAPHTLTSVCSYNQKSVRIDFLDGPGELAALASKIAPISEDLRYNDEPLSTHF
jgi:hypothetical protein